MLCALACLTGLESPGAQYYQVGQIVTNFTVYTRLLWTSPSGQVFNPGSPMCLSDFAGHVVFIEFFDPT